MFGFNMVVFQSLCVTRTIFFYFFVTSYTLRTTDSAETSLSHELWTTDSVETSLSAPGPDLHRGHRLSRSMAPGPEVPGGLFEVKKIFGKLILLNLSGLQAQTEPKSIRAMRWGPPL